MRVTHLGSHQAALYRVTSSLESMASSRDQVASGKRLRAPSDDPTGMSRALELRASMQIREQELRNASDGEMWINLADSKLQDAVERLQRARELAVRGASFSSTEERNGIAAEIAAIRDGLVEIANTRHQGRGLFAGFSAADAVQNPGSGWIYGGDAGVSNRRIGDSELIQVNVTAEDAFGFGSGSDVFTVLDDFETALSSGDAAGIDAAIAEIDGALDTAIGALTELGAAGARIEHAKGAILEQVTAVRTELSMLEDADMSEAVMELQLSQMQYEAALAAFARTSQASLVDFLR
jgi:flagellar hook-associated protein 3 FlgL